MAVALELDHDPHAVLVGLVVARRVIPSIFFSIASSAMAFDQVLLVHLVGDLGDDDLRLARSTPCSSICARARMMTLPRPVS